MGSDAENLAPLAERNLLPIRRLSSLIPLRKASRNRYAFQESNYHIQSDHYLHDASPAANTFHILEPQVWPPKHLRLRTEETPRKEVMKTMANFSTPQPDPPIRFPISPPPEDELRKVSSIFRLNILMFFKLFKLTRCSPSESNQLWLLQKAR